VLRTLYDFCPDPELPTDIFFKLYNMKLLFNIQKDIIVNVANYVNYDPDLNPDYMGSN
jgi:hypothetical protein